MALGKQLQEARMLRKLTPSQVAAGTRVKVQIIEDLERENFSRIAAPIYAKGFIRMYAEHVGLDPSSLIAEYEDRFASGSPAPMRMQAPVSDTPPDPETSGSPAAADIPERSHDAQQGELDEAGDKPKARRASAPGRVVRRLSELDLPQMARRGILARDRAVAGLRAAGARMRAKLNRAAGRIRPRNRDLNRPPDASRRSWRMISMVIGSALILVFVVSGLSRCIRRSQAEANARSLSSGTPVVPLGLPPPDPYLE